MNNRKSQFNSWQFNYQQKGKNQYNQNNRLVERDNFFNLTEIANKSANYSNNISIQLQKISQEFSDHEVIKERVNQVKRKNESNFENTNKELKKISDDIFYYENRKKKLHEDMQKIKDELKETDSILSKIKIKCRKLEKDFELEKRKNSIGNLREIPLDNKIFNNFNHCQQENSSITFDKFVSSSFQEKKEIKFASYDYIFETIDEIYKPEKVQFDKKSHYEITFNLKKTINFEEKTKGYKLILRGCLFDDNSEFQKDNLTFVKKLEILYQNKKKINESVSSKFIFPFDLTDYCRFDKKFTIIISFDPKFILKKEFGFGIFYVKKLKFDELSKLFQDGKIIKKKDPAITKKQIMSAFFQSNAISTETHAISLIDVLSKNRIRMPCIGQLCKHLTVFDGLSFLEINSNKFSWFCPLCCEPLSYEELFLDEMVNDILKKVSIDCTSIEFDKYSNWIPNSNTPKKNSFTSNEDDCILIDD